MRNVIALWVISGLAACVTGCSDDAKSDADHVRPGLRLATFNAGMGADVDLRDERLPLIAAALKEQSATLDVLCTQELWTASQWNAVKTAVAGELPNVLRRPDPPPPDPASAACTEGELQPLLSCVDANCANDPDLVSCAMAQCTNELGSVSNPCEGCIAAYSDQVPEDIFRLCTAGTAEPYGFDASLLSRLPFVQTDTLELTSAYVPSAVTYGRLDTELGEAHVFCTHLDDVAETQAKQINEELLPWIAEKTSGGGITILLGDLNSGPAGPGLTAVLPEGYAALTSAEFEDPFAAKAECTQCPDNTHQDPNSSATLPDHILLRSFDGTAQVTRILDERVTLADGTSVNLSDHYGLRAELFAAQR